MEIFKGRELHIHIHNLYVGGKGTSFFHFANALHTRLMARHTKSENFFVLIGEVSLYCVVNRENKQVCLFRSSYAP